MKEYRTAVVGATGAVGREFIKILDQRDFPMSSLRLLASGRSAGSKLAYRDQEIEVEETTEGSFEGVDIALFSAGAERSRHFGPIAAKAGAVVVDNSSAFRMDPEIPLVVPEINPEDILKHKGIIANPNCSTIQMVVALNPLHKVNPIRRVIVSTYQAASGAGAKGARELREQIEPLLEGKKVNPSTFAHQIGFNVIPQIDVFLDNGYTKEEWKMVEETKKIMHAPDMAISATCVRVPVYVGHSEAVWAEFENPMSPEEARRLLEQSPGIQVIDDPANSQYPIPVSSEGTDNVFVGRIRQDSSSPKGLVMWVVADNVRKGAALNAVQIAETMIQRDWI